MKFFQITIFNKPPHIKSLKEYIYNMVFQKTRWPQSTGLSLRKTRLIAGKPKYSNFKLQVRKFECEAVIEMNYSNVNSVCSKKNLEKGISVKIED